MSFRLPTSQEKSAYVHAQFERIANRYDLTNDIISLYMHRFWKKEAIKELKLIPNGHYLDLCCGTGDLSIKIADNLGKEAQVVGLDFSEQMLAVAKVRAQTQLNYDSASLKFIQADAQNLPFADNTFDGVIISFGLRNLSDIQLGLKEMTRVVKTGGRVINLDVGHPTMPVFTPLFQFYFRHVVPIIGAIVQKDHTAYTYLPESAKVFPPPEQLAQMMYEAGLRNVSYRELALGTVALNVGIKP